MKQMIFDTSVLNQIFPFCFTTDEAGTITHFGPSLKKMMGEQSSQNLNFSDVFKILRPAQSDFQKMISSPKGETIVLELRSPKAEFMGQVVHLSQSHDYLFTLNLVVQDASELAALNLDFNDFAIQDPIFDYLMLLQTQKRAIRQADESNQKLAEANRVAIQASETKSQFLANMSHELRTPMNGLLGMASILLETNLDTEQRDYVQTLIEAGENMLNLINDILDLSKIEAGFIQLESSVVIVDDLLSEVFRTLYPMAEKKKISLHFHITPEVPQIIFGDHARLRQVLVNLTGNAVKFTEKGFVKLSVHLLENTDDNIKLQFKIKDTGIGMDQGTLDRIFTPFVQGDSSMTKKFEGTGLGLAITKRIVNAMDGQIQVASQLGEGTEFTIDLFVKAIPASLARSSELYLGPKI